jgi:hypothetical protein
MNESNDNPIFKIENYGFWFIFFGESCWWKKNPRRQTASKSGVFKPGPKLPPGPPGGGVTGYVLYYHFLFQLMPPPPRPLMAVASFVMIDELRAWWGVKFSSAAPPGFVCQPKPDRCTNKAYSHVVVVDWLIPLPFLWCPPQQLGQIVVVTNMAYLSHEAVCIILKTAFSLAIDPN